MTHSGEWLYRPASMPATETRHIPDAALRLKAGPVQLLAPPEETEGDRRRFKLLARTVEPIPDWWWGTLVHDFEGMQVGDKIFVDYCHDAAEVLGFGDQFDITDAGLEIAGELTPFQDDDRASEVMHKADRGVPYQASIDFRGPCEFEWLPEGSYTEVNGQRLDGPAYIARQWTLRGVAICPLGWDTHTEAQLNRPDRETSIQLFTKGAEMPAPKAPAAKPTSQTAQQATSKPSSSNPDAGDQGATTQPAASSQTLTEGDGQPAGDPPSPAAANGDAAAAATLSNAAAPGADAPKATPEQAAMQRLQQFTNDFGAENGPKWFSEGKTHDEALRLHCQALTDANTKLTETNQQLETRISSAQLGEPEPVSGGAGDAPPSPEMQRLTQNIGGGLAKFAATLKLPGAK